MKYRFLNSARRWGGNERWTALAAQGLAVRNEVFFAYRKMEIGSRFDVPKYRLPFWNEMDMLSISRLIFLIKKHHIDILIPTKRKDYVLAGFAAKAMGKKNVLRLGIERSIKNTWTNRLVYNSLCDGIIVNAEVIKNRLVQSGFIPPEKIRIIYNGIDFPALQEKAKLKNGFIKPYDFTIAAMGELSRRKRMDLLLRAFSVLKKKDKSSISWGALIVGSGREKEKLSKLALDLEISDQVIFTGFLDNPYPLIDKCDVFVHTSKTEGIPNSMLEAMALKKPIITTGFGAAQEVVRNGSNGYLLKQGNAEELADRLIKLINDQNTRRSIAKEGYHSVKRMFSMERMVGEIEDFCSQI